MGFLSVTKIARRHQVTVPMLKKILAQAGYLDGKTPTAKAFEMDIVKWKGIDETLSPYGTQAGQRFPVWDAKKIGDMIIASGEAGSRPRRLVRHFDDVDHALHKALDKLEGVPAFRRTDKPADVLHYLCLDPIDLWDHHQIGGKPAAATYLRGKLAPTLRWLKTSTARNQAKVIEAKGLFEAIFEWLGEPMYMDRRTKAHRKPTASATERPMFGDAEDFGTANFSEEDLRFELELAAPHDVGEFHDSVDLSVSEPLTPEEVFIRALNAFPPERFDNLVRRAELIRRPVQEAVQASPKGRVALAREALTKVVTSARTLFGRRPHADE